MSRFDSLVDVGFKALNRFHRSVDHVTHGRLGRRAFAMTVIDLYTVGRRTGTTHRTILTVPVIDDGRLVVVASKGGDDRDPDWLRNLLAHPDVEVMIDGERRPFHAHVATPEETISLWPRVTAAYPGYARYQRRSQRDIPLVICDPR
jgi:deazaflavin-dependent oxidoreductase (nitroreductase family)